MVIGMATKKVTVTIDERQLELIRDQVTAGRASSVSGFVQAALRSALDAETIWAQHLASTLDATGGPASEAERAWAVDTLRSLDGFAPEPCED